MRISALKAVAAIYFSWVSKKEQTGTVSKALSQHLNVKSNHLAFITVLQNVAIKLWFLGSVVPKAKGCPGDKAACNPPESP